MKRLMADIIGLVAALVRRIAEWRRARRERKRRAKEAEYRAKLRGIGGK